MSLKNNHHYQKSELVDMDINSKIMEAVQFVNENNFNAIALTANERSQIQGLINNHEIITFLVNNYKGEIGFFRHHFSKFDTNISHCSVNQNLVRAQHTDTLFEVLQKMRDFRISSIIIERQFVLKSNPQKDQTESVGIVFLNDLMYLLRQINFHEILTQPVMKFVMHLNGTEEDRNAFKERVKRENETGNPSEVSSDGASNFTNPKTGSAFNK